MYSGRPQFDHLRSADAFATQKSKEGVLSLSLLLLRVAAFPRPVILPKGLGVQGFQKLVDELPLGRDLQGFLSPVLTAEDWEEVPTFSDLRLAIYSLSKDGDPEELCQSDDFRVQERLMKFFGISFHFHQFFQELAAVTDANISFLRPMDHQTTSQNPLNSSYGTEDDHQSASNDTSIHHLSRRNVAGLVQEATKELEGPQESQGQSFQDSRAEVREAENPSPIKTSVVQPQAPIPKSEMDPEVVECLVIEGPRISGEAPKTLGMYESLTPRIISGKRDSSVTVRRVIEPVEEIQVTSLCSTLTPQNSLPTSIRGESLEEIQIVRIDPSNYSFGMLSEEIVTSNSSDFPIRPLQSLGAPPQTSRFDHPLQPTHANRFQPITNPYQTSRLQPDPRKPDTRSLFVQRYERMLLGSSYAREDIFARNVPKENHYGLPNRRI